MEKSSHYEINAQYEEGNSNEVDKNVRNLIVGSILPRKQEIKKFSHTCCLIRLRLAPKITCKSSRMRVCPAAAATSTPRHPRSKATESLPLFFEPVNITIDKSLPHFHIFVKFRETPPPKSHATPPSPQPHASTYSLQAKRLMSPPKASLTLRHQRRKRHRGCHESL